MTSLFANIIDFLGKLLGIREKKQIRDRQKKLDDLQVELQECKNELLRQKSEMQREFAIERMSLLDKISELQDSASDEVKIGGRKIEG